jgi:LysM repeat protein
MITTAAVKAGIKSLANTKLVKRAIYWKLQKLTIFCFDDAARKNQVGEFKAMFNPESYTLNYENVYGGHQGINTTGSTATYTLSKPSILSFRLILDGTGATEYNIPLLDAYAGFDFNNFKPTIDKAQTVSQRIEKFLALTAHMDGKLHEPKYLTLQWGTFIFKCRLKSVKINYTLFDPSGDPLRAELDTVFVNDMDKKERVMRASKSSPDLTHRRTVKAGDTLPLLCHEIYGSEHYYLEVAKANKLVDFRNLTPGQELFFPPFEKQL